MDILRAALGERQLDYFGASYGTLLGATYADLFPDERPPDGARRRDRPLAVQRAADPRSGPRVRDRAARLPPGLRRAGRLRPGRHRRRGRAADRGSCSTRSTPSRCRPARDRELTEGLAVLGIILPLYVEGVLAAADRCAQAGDRRGRATSCCSWPTSTPRAGRTVTPTTRIEALYAVNCLDHSDSIPSSQVPSHFADFEKASPTFGRFFAYGLSTCASWPVKSGNRTTALDAAGAPPIVVVGTTRDPATPYERAVALAEQLESGVLISRDGDGHTGFNQGNKCVDRGHRALPGGRQGARGRPVLLMPGVRVEFRGEAGPVWRPGVPTPILVRRARLTGRALRRLSSVGRASHS